MSITEDNSISGGPRQSSSATCKALLSTATPEMFRTNAFRITGLPVDATIREITKHADKLKMMEELGQGESAHTGAFALTPPPTLDQIRDAIQALRDPEQRILHEFFWFWPEESGNSAQDPAIQALARGDREAALEIWTLKETSPTGGVTALHNIAVLWQFVALEWEEHAGQEEADDERRKKIDRYWRDAFKRWNLLAVDDLLWERVSARVRQLDDPRLTTGFVRKMRATLPQALDKINAELAVRYAERGRMNLAQVHVGFLRENSREFDSLHKTAELVLAPTTARLKQQIDRAQQRAASKPVEAINAARELLNHAPSSLILFELFFGKTSPARNELADEVASVCNRLQLAYHKATDDNQGCLDVLHLTLPFAPPGDIRLQIEKNIATLNNNIAYARLEPVLGILRGINEGTDSPKVKFARIKQQCMTSLADLIRNEGSASHTARTLSDSIAISLRNLSIAAYNDHDDIVTALEANTAASDLAQETDFKKRLLEDKAQLARNKAEEEKHNLFLKIRSDTIEVSREKFRYNSRVLPASDIDGVRLGIFTQYTNGVKSSVSYKIAVKSASHGAVEIECKRIFRSEAKASADYQGIIGALYYQIIPRLVQRLAARIVAGGRIPLGDCTMTDKGILASTGMLFWTKDHVIPWTDVRFGIQAGYLAFSSATNPKVKKTFLLRTVWNAVIFKELANAVVTLQSKQRPS